MVMIALMITMDVIVITAIALEMAILDVLAIHAHYDHNGSNDHNDYTFFFIRTKFIRTLTLRLLKKTKNNFRF